MMESGSDFHLLGSCFMDSETSHAMLLLCVLNRNLDPEDD